MYSIRTRYKIFLCLELSHRIANNSIIYLFISLLKCKLSVGIVLTSIFLFILEYFLECGDDLEEAMVYQIVTEESEYGCNEDDTDVGLLIDGTFRQSEHEHEEVDNFVYSMKEVANSKDIQMPIQFKRYSNTHSHTSKISNLDTVIGSHKINVHSPIVELRNEVVVKKVKKLANLLAVTNLKANNRAYKKIKSIRRSRQNPH